MADTFRKIDDASVAKDTVVTTVYSVVALQKERQMHQSVIDSETARITEIDAILSQCQTLGIQVG